MRPVCPIHLFTPLVKVEKFTVPFILSVDHLTKYLAVRLTIDLNTEISEAERLSNFCIYIAPQPSQFLVLNGNQMLQQVNEKIWKVNHTILPILI